MRNKETMKTKKSKITFTIEKQKVGYEATLYQDGKVMGRVSTYYKSNLLKSLSSQKKLQEQVKICNVFR